MPRVNEEVARLFQEYAQLLSIAADQGAYRARAYEKAARSIAGHQAELTALDDKAIQKIPNVGASVAEKVRSILATGTFPQLDELRQRIPAGVRQMMSIPSLGPHKARALHDELGISGVDDLVEAIRAERLSHLKGFGPKTAEKILRGVELMERTGQRVHLNVARDLAEELVEELSRIAGCERCAYAGSLRRMAETIGDVDVLAASEDPEPLMERLCSLPVVDSVLARGPTKSSVRTRAGLQVDLRVVRPTAWGAALQYFTGSKAHNVRLRELALRKGLKLSEYGLFDADSGDLLVARTEEEVYGRLGIPWIPPTLREDRGEIEAAQRGELPVLVEEEDLRGDLHTHTDLTDGVSSLEEMLSAMAQRRYRYYAVTDHAPNLPMQQMTDEKILRQREQVRALAGRYRTRVLHGVELNIAPDGSVDWPGEFLAGFDLCVASIHSHFGQSKEEMTRRLIRACENPYVNVIGHPSARLIGRRPPVEVDLDAVFEAAARTGTAMEIDSFPDRLDLNDEQARWAKEHGVRFAVDSDAHATVHLANIAYGIGTAQRAWLTKDDVINTWPWAKLRAFLRKGRRLRAAS